MVHTLFFFFFVAFFLRLRRSFIVSPRRLEILGRRGGLPLPRGGLRELTQHQFFLLLSLHDPEQIGSVCAASRVFTHRGWRGLRHDLASWARRSTLLAGHHTPTCVGRARVSGGDEARRRH